MFSYLRALRGGIHFSFGCGFAMMEHNEFKGNLIKADADEDTSAHDPITFDARSRFRVGQSKRLALSPGTGELTRARGR